MTAPQLTKAARLWLAVLLALCLSRASAEPLSILLSTKSVFQYQKTELQILGVASGLDPFDPEHIKLDLEVTQPQGLMFTVPCFYVQPYSREQKQVGGAPQDWIYPDGPPRWMARFSAFLPGLHRVRALCQTRTATVESASVEVEVMPAASRGYIRVSRKDPRFLEFSDGTPFFPIGQNLAFIGSQQYVTLSRAERIFQRLSEHGANYVRVWTCCEDWAMAIEAKKSAWGRSWGWNPPFADVPQAPGGGRCLEISSKGVRPEPSHPVALKKEANYVLTGFTRTLGSGALVVSVQGERGHEVPEAYTGPWVPFRREFRAQGDWLRDVVLAAEGPGKTFVASLSLKEQGQEAELLWEAEVNRDYPGFYNPLDCYMLDSLVETAEENGIFLQLTLLSRDLYMGSLGDSYHEGYDEAIRHAQHLLRYAVGRWGYSTSVAAWEYWNEMNPGLPTDRFYRECGEFLERTDPYHHLRSTSAWGPAPNDYRHPCLEVADLHFYLRPADAKRYQDEVEAVCDRIRWLRAQAPGKPVWLGEFGLADDQWRITEEMKRTSELADVHNALWASALSGASGTALPWWWERLDERGGYDSYLPLSRFLAGIPWNSGRVEPVRVVEAPERLRVAGIQSGNCGWVWLFDRQASWLRLVRHPVPAPGLEPGVVEFEGFSPGSYKIHFYDTRSGELQGRGVAQATQKLLRVEYPAFSRDLALRIEEAAP